MRTKKEILECIKENQDAVDEWDAPDANCDPDDESEYEACETVINILKWVLND